MTLVATCNTATALALNEGFLFRKDVCACVRVCVKPKAACLSNQALCFAAKWPAFCQNALVSPLKQPCFWSKSVQHAVTCPYVLHSRCGQTSIMQEYLSSSNVSEARHCLHKLAVPFFNHEVVNHYVSCRSICPVAMCLKPGTACTSWQCPSSITRWSSKPCCA